MAYRYHKIYVDRLPWMGPIYLWPYLGMALKVITYLGIAYIVMALCSYGLI